MKQRIKIDVVSDVVCPWCYIGKRRLERALQSLENEFEFDLEYHPFELNPDMPAAGADQKSYLVQKFGSEEKYETLTSHVAEVAQGEGLLFDMSRQKVSPNTRKAHSLIQLAKNSGRQQDMVEALFSAYFSEGVDLSKDENLVRLAAKAGLEKETIEKVLNDDNSLLQIALEEQEMYKLGISGVPFYIINKRYGISGAQASETFIKALQEVGKEVA